MVLCNAEGMFDMQQTFGSYNFDEACNATAEESFSKVTVVAPGARCARISHTADDDHP